MGTGQTVNVGGEWVDGFQVGRAAALSDWEFRKEQADFEKLCSRLYQRNWARKFRRENPERVRANLRRWRERNRDKINAKERARRRATRPVCECVECGKTWVVPFGERKAKYCSRKCRNKWHGRKRTREGRRNRGVRDMRLSGLVFRILRRSPWLTRNEILERAPGLKPGSVSSKLSEWVKTGALERDGTPRSYRYAVKGAAVAASG